MSPEKKLILIDGHSIIISSVFGSPIAFVQMLLRLLQDEKPTHLVVAFDKGTANFRQDICPNYKSTCATTFGTQHEQVSRLREFLQSSGIPCVEIEGYEAADIIGTLTKRAETDGYQSLVVTGDKGLLQIVSERVTTMVTRKGITEMEKYDVAHVQEKYGLAPSQIIDLKGLMGDMSNNVPGIPGVGEMIALKLLAQHPSVEDVLAHADEAPGTRLQKNLQAHAKSALLSKKIATILRDVPLENVDLERYACSSDEASRVREKFKSLLNRWQAGREERSGDMSVDDTLPLVQTKVVSQRDLAPLLHDLSSPVGIWLDLTGTYQQGNLVGIAIATEERAWYLPLAETNGGEMVGEVTMRDADAPRAILPSAVREFLANREQHLVFFDLKAALVTLRAHEVEVNGSAFCTLLASYLLNPADGASDLYDLIKRYVGWEIETLPTGTGKKNARVSLKERAQHAGSLAAANARMQKPLKDALCDKQLFALYQDLELPLTYVLAKMEEVGVRIDPEELRAIGGDLKWRIENLQAEIWTLAGENFNLNSPKQVGEVLFEKLRLQGAKKTKTGYSTTANVLEKLASGSPIAAKVLDYRQLVKLNSTYVEGLLVAARYQGEEHARVHTQFNQALTATGRLSSTEPNLQNIPIRTEEGRRLRHVFVPSQRGWKLLVADYSQIELRILADMAGDEHMIDAFVHELDIHKATASDVFEVALEDVDENQRRAAKAVNFGIVYGISDVGLSKKLNVSRKVAAQFIENYFAKFSGVKAWMEAIVEQAHRDGFVKTKWGRIRPLPDLRSSNFNVRSFAERTAINTPIQGTAADLIKKAMVSIAKRLEAEQFAARMLLQVHDELMFEVPEEEIESLSTLVRREMEGALPDLRVPLTVDLKIGDTWGIHSRARKHLQHDI